MKSFVIIALLVAVAAAVPVCEAPNFGCTSCKIVVNSIEKMLASNKTQEFIIKTVEQLCETLPDNFEPACDRVIEIGIPTVIRWLTSKVNAEKVCERIHLCGNPANSTVTFEKIAELVDINAIDFAREEGMTADKLKGRLVGICEVIPVQAHAQKCMEIVSRMNLVMLLNSAKNNQRRDDFNTCDMCVEVLDIFKVWIKDNAADALEEKAQVLCEKMGQTIQPICISLLKATFSSLKNYLTDKFSARDMCTAIQIC